MNEIKAHSYNAKAPVDLWVTDALEETGDEGILVTTPDGCYRLDLLNAAALVAHLSYFIKKQYKDVGDVPPIE